MADQLQGDHVFENAHHFSIDQFHHTANIVNNYHYPADDTSAISTWLTTTNHWGFHSEVSSRITPGTGRWFLDAAEFQDWLTASAGSLWVTGMPGAGKTGLATTVIEYLHQRRLDTDEGAVTFAYCHYVSRCESRDMLCSFIRQLLEAYPSEIRPILQPVYRRHYVRRALLKEADALQLLRGVLSRIGATTIFVVDGLDEMPDEERDKALLHLTALPVKLLIFSRPMSIFLEHLPGVKRIEMEANSADIEQFVRESLKISSRLQAILKGQRQLEQKIPSTIMETCGGMFLIAVLQVEALKRCLNVDALRKILASMPSGVDRVYEDTLRRIDAQTTQEASVARRALLWIVHAKRCLTVSELRDALATSYSKRVFNQDAVINIDIILSICYGLVTVKAGPKGGPQEEPHVALIHYTADSYLRKIAAKATPSSHNSADITTLTCTTYLLHHRDGLSNLLSTARGLPADIWVLEGFLDSRPFLRYAYQYWGHHAADLELDDANTHLATFSAIHRFLVTFGGFMEPDARELPLQIDQDGSRAPFSFHFAQLLNPAHIAARYGLVGLWSLVKKYGWELTRGEAPPCRWTALHLAAYYNQVEMVKRMLPDIPPSVLNFGDADKRTALAIAASRCNEVVVQVLLTHHSILVDEVALGTAVRGGNLAIVQLLLPKITNPMVPLVALNWLLPGGRRILPMESFASTIKMPAGGAQTSVEWESPTIWLEILGEYNPSDMISLLFQHPALDINNPLWLGVIHRGERGVDIIRVVLRQPEVDINMLFERAMETENQDYASFLLWHPPISMAVAACPGFDVSRAVSAARRHGRSDMVQSLLQSPFTNDLNSSLTLRSQSPQPAGIDDPQVGEGDRQLIEEIMDEYIERFRAEHTSPGPPQREFVFSGSGITVCLPIRTGIESKSDV